MSAVSVNHVAEYILSKQHPISAIKLQKLVYYSQAWSLVWDEQPLFEERIEAWAMGPVVPDLYHMHGGKYMVDTVGGNPSLLNKEQKKTVDAVYKVYGSRPAYWLIELSHQEEPWLKARNGLPAGVNSNAEIKLADMAAYYSGLV